MSRQMMHGPHPPTTYSGGVPQRRAVVEPAKAEAISVETVPAAKPRFGSDFSEVRVQTDERVALATPVPPGTAPYQEAEPVSPATQQPINAFGDEPVVEAAVTGLRAALADIPGTPAAGAAWSHVTLQVRRPRSARRAGAPPSLYTPELVVQLQALSNDEAGKPVTTAVASHRQGQVLRRVFTDLLTTAEQRLGTGGDGRGDPGHEWSQLPTTTRDYVDGGFAGYCGVRLPLLAAFGALEVGTASAIKRANAYYDKIVTVTFLGKKVPAHAAMAESLTKAQRLLNPSGKSDPRITTQITSVGGIDIRFNANNPLVLSEHSFGAAIDINARLNPNVPNFPVSFIQDVAGTNLAVTGESRHETKISDTGDPGSAEAERLLAASTKLTEVFRDEASLTAGIADVASRLATVPSVLTPAGLLAAVQAARAEGPHARWRYADPKATPSRHAPSGPAHDALADLLFPPGATMPLPESPAVVAHRRRVIELLIQMVDVYEHSFTKDGKGRTTRVPPTERSPSLSQLAVHGFVNLPAQVIAALRAPDGGNLRWLGSGDHPTRDFMHFELKTRPPLY